MRMAIDVGGFGRPTPTGSARPWRPSGAWSGWPSSEAAVRRGGPPPRASTPPPSSCSGGSCRRFANYGFPESHSVSFAYLVYARAWLKRWYPAAFCAGLLLGPARWASTRPTRWCRTPVATRVVVRTPDLNASAAGPTLETDGSGGR